ncbi:MULTISPECIES: PTS mannitol transporter subunit IICB [Paenibacillus]|uniref:PTS system mannitol-specific EIICB component n=1 Tax=Paenibacillus azoreducens TaxID=116718 RepID=A0A919YGF9_9BACL|nr:MULTISPECIES: PTS mannitol transporter subunit IICBA [Paenibacillus]MBE9915600.1 PTS mannitol transporter subunit IICBA [Paenibacillus donghaensis]GIO47947.1 PTS system mannitol-specific EIICB component [Paenibacillus azoreducens]
MAQSTSFSASGAARVGVQKFGRFLSGMVMPNIGAFIAWGLITALFIPTGWIPNEYFAKLVDPMIKYLLPLLIGYTGGTMVHKQRGGVIGALVTMGVIIGTDIPMFLGAMAVGPGAAWVLKKFDQAVEGKIKSGFEMLVNNFSLGIIGGVLVLITYSIVGRIIEAVTNVLSSGVEFLVHHHLIPLVNILIEPAKVLFLNNAINHGVLSPIAIEQAQSAGKSILFMLESNPGPGLGVLLAYMIVGRGSARQSASGAAIIHFFGGIHEIYFPYILMNPRLILAAMAGGVTGTFTFSLMNAGLVGPPSPGSIIAYLAMAPRGEILPVLSGVITAAIVSFAVAALLLKTSKKSEEDREDLDEATQRVKDMKAAGTYTAAAAAASEGDKEATPNTGVTGTAAQKSKEEVHKIIVACDAGMGSSAMGASILRKKMKAAGSAIEVINTAISDIPSDSDIVVTHKTLTDRAREVAPQAEHISIDNFLKSPEYDELVERLK